MRATGKVADGLEAEKKTETWYQLVSAYNRLHRLEVHGRFFILKSLIGYLLS